MKEAVIDLDNKKFTAIYEQFYAKVVSERKIRNLDIDSYADFLQETSLKKRLEQQRLEENSENARTNHSKQLDFFLFFKLSYKNIF